ncbi:hypothetical protein R1flu_015033 [Riccia fluitans]|uniref:PH domain-containing protein n=1 Tax=Riccia fluitans TaxID=41844 RepID=A0ABD1YHX4_9MARC
MNNQALLWMNPDKQGLLKKRGGKRKNWKQRQFLVKDTFLFYFKISKGGEHASSPSGVVPLQGSKVDFSPLEDHETEGDEPAPSFVFVIFLPDKLLTEGVVKRNTYLLGSENLTDCYMWMSKPFPNPDCCLESSWAFHANEVNPSVSQGSVELTKWNLAEAIRHASTSRRNIKGQLNHARMELTELEARWNVCKAIDTGEVPLDEAILHKNAGEDPLILQALSDELMILYHLLETTEKGLNEERAKMADAQRQFEIMQHLKDLQLMKLSEDGKRDEAEAEYKKHYDLLVALIKKRFELRKVSEQLEMFEGRAAGGPGLPSMTEVERMLLTTIEELKKLDDEDAGTEQMPCEDRLVELQIAMVPIQEEYVELLNLATSGKKRHERAVAAEAAQEVPAVGESSDSV